MKIYLDIIWALNFLFDAFLLYLTAIILKRHVKWWRLLMGGLIGANLILLSITRFHEFAGHPAGKFAVSILMVWIVFGFKRFSYFFKALMTFYLTTFLLGGTLTGLHYFLQFDVNLASNVAVAQVKGYGDSISWLFVILGFPLAWHFSRKNIEQFEMTKINYQSLAEVEIHFMDMNLKMKGLIDSGNQLCDPITKTPVMIVSIRKVQDQISDEMIRLAKDPESFLRGEWTISPQLEGKLRIIPFKVVGQDHQLIVAFDPDHIKIETQDGVFNTQKGLVSFTAQELSGEDRFHCIIHPKMLTGMSKSEHSEKVS